MLLRAMRAHLPFAGLLGAVTLILLVFTWSEFPGQPDGDNAIYYMTARHYAPYVGHDRVAQNLAETSVFPPLYPALLAVTGGAADIRWAHAVTTLFLVVGLAVYYFWLIEIGLGRGLAGIATLIFAAMPGTWTLALSLQSEMLYLPLAFAALILLARAETSDRDSLTFWAACMIGAAVLCRTAGIALLAGMVVLLFRKRPRVAGMALAIAVIPSLIWSAVHQPPKGYAAAIAAHYSESPYGVLEEWFLNLVSVAWGFASNALQTGFLLVPLGLIGCLALGTMLYRFWKGSSDAWYSLAYVTMIVIWPYPAFAQRLTWVLVPVALGYALWGASRLANHAPHTRVSAATVASSLVAAVTALAVSPSLAIAIERWNDPLARQRPVVRHLPAWYRADYEEARFQGILQVETFAAIRDMGELVPDGDCVRSIDSPTVSYYSGRLSMELPPEDVSDATLWEDVSAHRCRYLILVGSRTEFFDEALYPYHRLRDKLTVLGQKSMTTDGRTIVLAALVKVADD